jgi:hypothetical protein
MAGSLAGSLETVAAMVPWCSYRLGPPPGGVTADPLTALATGGWLRCREALDDPRFFIQWQRELGRRMAAQYAVAPAVTTAGYIMGWYCGLFGFLGGMLFNATRRVPSLAPDNIAFKLHPALGRPADVALLDGAFVGLPSDPYALAGPAPDVPAPDVPAPDVTVLADDGQLAVALRAEVAGHGEQFVAAYRRASRFGPHTLWGAVTDSVERGLWHIAHRCGQDAAGAGDAALVLPRRLPPFTSGSTIHSLTDQRGRPHWTRIRRSCCFYYKLPGAVPCASCPRLTEAQRRQRLS